MSVDLPVAGSYLYWGRFSVTLYLLYDTGWLKRFSTLSKDVNSHPTPSVLKKFETFGVELEILGVFLRTCVCTFSYVDIMYYVACLMIYT